MRGNASSSATVCSRSVGSLLHRRAGTCQGKDPGDHTPQPGHQTGADDLGAKPVPERVGDVLPLSQREDAPRAGRRVELPEAALCAAEATKTGPVDDLVPGQTWGSRPGGRASWAGAVVRLVADGREPAGERSHEQPVVQGAGACQPHRKVSCATILRRTAGYGPVRPVVWGDGGREPPSHPMCARHALCLERESLTDGGSTGDRMDSPGPWGTGDVCDRAG